MGFAVNILHFVLDDLVLDSGIHGIICRIFIGLQDRIIRIHVTPYKAQNAPSGQIFRYFRLLQHNPAALNDADNGRFLRSSPTLGLIFVLIIVAPLVFLARLAADVSFICLHDTFQK